MHTRKLTTTIRDLLDDLGFQHSVGARCPWIPTSGVTMLRSIQSTAFLGTLLLAGAAAAAAPSAAASDATPVESAKPETKSAAAPAAPAESATPVAVPAPEPEDEAMPTPVAAKKPKSLESAGLSSQSLSQGGGSESSETTAEKDWGFKFKGYFRGPMRVSIDNSGSLTPGKLQFHAPPVVPDGNYTRWAFTGIAPGPWAELFFQYGNQRVMMTTTIASYNITSGGWRELQDQLGIDRAFLTLKFPEALGSLGGMSWDVGVFSNFYGALGKYDGGEYQTFLFGRTRIAGATATADMELSDDLKLVVEAGAGAKMDQQYQTYGMTTLTNSSHAADSYYPSWQPYPGDKDQVGTTLLAHGHAGLVINGQWTITGHYIGSFVRDARYNVASQGGTNPADTKGFPGLTPDASIQVFGADLRLNGGWMGDGYIGYSRVRARHANSVADSIELLQSQGGWQLSHNFFADGNGNIDSIAGQYTFSVAAFMMRPRPFWGQGADITITAFGMLNRVSGTDEYGTGDGSTIPADKNANMTKFKWGVDPIWSFSSMMAVGMRFDWVNPDMSDSGQSFQVFSPKLIFRSEFVTHEMIVLQGSFYHYGSSYSDSTKVGAIMPWPFGTNGTSDLSKLGGTPDKYAISLAASMWW
jgi:hypothetical protein